MTKHLRLLLLALLTMVCMGGYSSVGDTYKVVTSVDELQAGDVIAIASKDGGAALGTAISNSRNAPITITISEGSFQMIDDIAELTLEKDNDGWYFVTADNKYWYSSAKKKMAYSDSKSKYATIAIATSGSYDATICFPTIDKSNCIRHNGTYGFSNYASTTGKSVQIYKKQASDKTATSLSFTGLEGKSVVLANGKLGGEDFAGYKAVEANGVAGTIAYTSSNQNVAIVDNNGKVVVDEDVYGETTITATFTPTDADAYLSSKASYTIKNTHFTAYDNVADLRAALDNGTLTADDSHFIQVTFTDAKVVYKNEWTSNGNAMVQYFIREGEGENAKAICLYQPGISLRSSSKLNGKYTGVVYSRNGLLCLTKCENTSADELTESYSSTKADPLEISTDDVAKHVCDLVAVKGATVTNGLVSNGTSETATAPTFFNQFASGTASMKLPYSGANIDMNSAIVITYQKNSSSDMLYELCPTEANSVVYYFSEDNAETKLGTNYDVPVVLKRTFKEGEWNTLCLPFGLIESQLKALFGDDVQVRTLSAVNGNTLTFKEATELAAEQPCLIKLGNIAENNTYTATGLTIEAHTDGANKCTPTDGATSMVGVYQLTDVTTQATGKALFLGDGNKFYQAAADTQMKGFRAYFDVPTDTDPNKVQAVIDGATTGIDALNGDVVKQNGRVYNLNGQCVGTSLEQLQRGVYIQNGKKVVVK